MESNLQEGLSRLSELYDNWLLNPKQSIRSKIEDSVIEILNNRYYVSDDIYIEACGGNASGLCSHGFFERDLQNLISILKSRC